MLVWKKKTFAGGLLACEPEHDSCIILFFSHYTLAASDFLNIFKLLISWNITVYYTRNCDFSSIINPFHATNLIWYSLETSAYLWLSDVFKGVSKEISGMKWLNEMNYFLYHVSNQTSWIEVLTKSSCGYLLP